MFCGIEMDQNDKLVKFCTEGCGKAYSQELENLEKIF